MYNSGINRHKTKEQSVFVSIIVVVYNSENLIKYTLDSIVNQSSDNYELIIIDGGSTDLTLQIINDFREDIDKIISEPDKGIYDAMNKGLKLARGRYVWFINSGDEIESPHTLNHIESLGTDADIYYGETYLINSQRKVLGTRTDVTTRKLPDQLTWQNLKYGMVVCHQSILVKRELCKYYDLKYKCSADLDWVIHAVKKSRNIINCRLVLSKYLVGGFSLGNSDQCWKERFRIYLMYYGWISTIYIHIFILFRAMFHKIYGRQNY